jgi:hypothetical protein
MADNIIDIVADAAGSLAKLNPATAIAKEGIDSLTGGVKELIEDITNGIKAYESYRIELTKATGANAKFVDTIRQEAYELGKYGITFKNLVDINKDIANSYSQATFSSAQTRTEFEGQRKEVEKLIGINQKFDVGTDTTIKLLNQLGNSVYNNVEQVSKFSDSLLKFSKETGQPFAKVLQEFGTYSDRFITAISSDKATQSFATLELLARRSGASIDNLVKSISKFDDIDQAFSTGGQLNRVLSYFGGSFDTLAAANASDEERAQMLIRSISSISDKFNQVTNPQARRSMLRELESASGLPMEMITGLLNKSNKLSEDLTSIMRTPVEVIPSIRTYSDEEKKAMAMEVTDLATTEEIKEESLKMGTTISMIEKVIAANKQQYVDTVVQTGKQLDVSTAKLLKEGDLKGAIDEAAKAAKNLAENVMSPGSFADALSKAISGETGALATYAKKLSVEGQIGDRKALDTYSKITEEMEKRRDVERRNKKKEDIEEAKKSAASYAQDLANKIGNSVKVAFGDTKISFTFQNSSGKPEVIQKKVADLLNQ